MIKLTLSLLLLFSFVSITHSSCNVTEIKNIVSNQLLYAGNVSSSASSTNNLYFLFYGRHGVIDDSQLYTHPTIVVFGNPGSSSHYLNFGGLGPLLVTSNLTLAQNPNSATQFANLLFLDPLGVGFSFAENIKDVPSSYNAIAQQIVFALGQIKNKTNFGKGKWIFLGESSWIKTISGFQNLDDNLVGIISLSPWGDMYDIGKYYGVAGVEFGLLTNAQKNTVESTYTTCYLYIKNGKFAEAHKCYDETLNYILTKTNNRNLFNINFNSTLIDTFSKIQYYLCQPGVVNTLLAPQSHFFEYQANTVQKNLYAQQAQSNSQNISFFMRDYLSVKYLFAGGKLDYLSYYKATRGWLDSLNFIQSAQYKGKAYENITVDGKVVGEGKSVKQVKYVQINDAGHYLYFDQAATINGVIKEWVAAFDDSETPKLIEQ